MHMRYFSFSTLLLLYVEILMAIIVGVMEAMGTHITSITLSMRKTLSGEKQVDTKPIPLHFSLYVLTCLLQYLLLHCEIP